MTADTTTLSGYLLDYYTALAEDMPNPDLDVIERVLDMADGMSRFGSEEFIAIQDAIAALKRLRGVV